MSTGVGVKLAHPVLNTDRSWVSVVSGATLAASLVLGIILFGLSDFRDRNDFHLELWPAYQALYAGHVRSFISLSPSYIGAVVWRAPFALIAMALGAGWKVTYFVTAVPCLIAVPLFGVWFASRSSLRPARGRQVMGLFAAIAVVDPVLWYAGILGHPEELVGTVLALAAVILAADRRMIIALVFVALAVLNKPGLIEIVPVVIAARRARYSGVLLALGVIGAGLYALDNLTTLFVGLHLPASLQNGAITAGAGFYPFQLLWGFGANSYWVVHEHALFPLLSVGLVAIWLLRRRLVPEAREMTDLRREALWLAALLLLVRTAVEPWDNTYYNIPFVLCLLCLDGDGIPVMAIAASLGVLMLVPTNRILPVSASGQAALYAVVVIPVLCALLWRTLGPHTARSLSAHSMGPAEVESVAPLGSS